LGGKLKSHPEQKYSIGIETFQESARMPVSAKRLSLFIDHGLPEQRGVTKTSFAKAVRKFYCPAMTLKGLCTKECEKTCQQPLLAVLEGIYPNARSPMAVLTWRLRGAPAIQAEKRAASEKGTTDQQRDGFGLVIEATGLEALAAMLGD
jgi:hypothetical protein